MDTINVQSMLTQVEDCMNTATEEDPEWHSCEIPNDTSVDTKDIEIVVSNTSHKPGRIIDVAQSLRRIELEKRKQQFLEVHKVHLLLLLAHGMQVSRLVNVSIVDNSSELYDLISDSKLSVREKDSLHLVKSIVDHYRKNVMLATTRNGTDRTRNRRTVKIKKAIHKQIVAREASCRRMYNLILLTVLRFCGIRSRLVMHLDVVPSCPPVAKPPAKVKISQTNRPLVTERYHNVPLTTTEILKRKPEIQEMFQLTQLDGADDDLVDGELAPKKLRIEGLTNKPRLWKLKPPDPWPVKQPRDKPLNQIGQPVSSLSQSDQQGVKLVSSKFFRKKPSLKQRSTKGKLAFKTETNDQKNATSIKPNLGRLINHKVATVSSDCAKKRPRIPKLDLWIECFLEAEQRWTVVEASLGEVDCMEQVMDLIQDPPVYVFAFEAVDDVVVDVSERYRWRNEALALRQRVDKKWLKKALHRYRPPMGDEAFLLEQLEYRQLKFRAPMPTTIGQFKNHPSYCLPRDLQKFQGIYPPDAPPLGYINGEPVYARECVHTLHSREVWLRHAKVIRMHELPYKIVKSKLRREQTNLELFGYWQTEDYIPPEPVDGIVPRNAYGNIEIFKDCMLPKGTVHLKQFGLSHICRKLGIDYAVAVVGFGVHAGGNHPVFDGIVICAEHRDRLLAAWEIHQDESAQKKLEKKRQIVLNNWVKLVKGLLVRRKLKNKYNFDGM
ncbi:DNA repair protein complementing XP-C cells homolog isoform X2 [Anopheles coustani]|nr:DNA repair protein complementing XP-C cells homolog isoform X2 [Anopheles coustani]